MKEKELRLALVCYGGVSLVLYMHGVIKEILKLSRASKAYHSVPRSEKREHQSYEAANGDDGRPHDTEDVYFALLQSIGRTLNLRVIVDSIAGCQSAFKFDPVSASNFDPFERRVLTVALASSELAGVAETWRARAA